MRKAKSLGFAFLCAIHFSRCKLRPHPETFIIYLKAEQKPITVYQTNAPFVPETVAFDYAHQTLMAFGLITI